MKKLLALILISLPFGLIAGDLTWETDYEKAIKMATEQNKVVLINFSGSDWCGWCKRLDREVFSKEAFKTFADEKLVLLKVDFPKFTKLPKEQEDRNWALYEKYNVMGFPTILVVDKSGNTKVQTGYQRGGAEAYIDHLTSRYQF